MDTQLTCVACAATFAFTDAEQSFYEAKGFNPPKKCKTCRDAAKTQRRGGGGGGYGGGAPKQWFDVTCNGCGAPTQVPFQPNGSKPVFCKPCFQDQRASFGGGNDRW